MAVLISHASDFIAKKNLLIFGIEFDGIGLLNF